MLQFKQSPQLGSGADVQRIAQEHDLSPLLASLLAGRGLFAYEEIRAFLYPHIGQLHDPYLLQDMQQAVTYINGAIQAQRLICVYGDYDADGVCATAILLQYLQSAGARVMSFIPSRHQEGYGLQENALRQLAQQGVSLIITVDNGISAAREVALARSLGMDVIVTDHHQCPQQLPDGVAVINPHRPHSRYPNPDLCGAGVALKLVQALGGNNAIQPHLPLAALATVADVVALKGENRAIVAAGLPLIPGHIGLSELLSVAGGAGQAIGSDTLAFRLAPRLNAAGRMGDASRALSLLISRDTRQARELAHTLNEENERRQAEEQRMLREARAMLSGRDVVRTRAILLYSPDWNPGVTGIVAAKLAEEYYRPALLFHQQGQLLTGSCRSVQGVHLFECLQVFAHCFVRFGGHAQAAGVTMELSRFDEFAQAFDTYLYTHIPPETWIPCARYEKEVGLGELSMRDVEALSILAPYGEGNLQPVFCARGIRLEDISRMGRDESHLRAIAVQGDSRAGLVAFGQGRKANEWAHEGVMDLLYTPEINVWQNNKRLQLMFRAAKPVAFFVDSSYILRQRLKFHDAFFRNILYNVTHGAVNKFVEPIAIEDMESQIVCALSGNVNGTLIVCATPGAAQRLRKLLIQHELQDFIDIYWHDVPQASGNAALLAPYPGYAANVQFERAFLYDGHDMQHPGCDGTDIVVPLQGGYEEFLAPLQISREEMGKIYRAYLTKAKSAPVPRAMLLNEANAFSRETAQLALLTFVELGFFIWDESADTVAARQDVVLRSLWESRIYITANKGQADAAPQYIKKH